MTPDLVPQNTNEDFQFQLEGNSLSGFTYIVELKQFPDDAAAISRTVTADANNIVDVTLTPAEIASLDVGIWRIIMKSTDTDEALQSVKRIQVTRGWD